MRSRSLGSGRPDVTVVGSGEIGLALAAARGIDPGEVARAVHAAIDRGLTLIDVAAEDGAERVVGDAIRTLRARDHVVVTTRVAPMATSELLPSAYVQQQIEGSLRATRLDALPLALLPHRRAWTRMSTWADLRGACARMVQDGKVICWGAVIDPLEPATSEDDPASVAGIAKGDHIGAVVLTYNACDRAAAPVIATAAALGIAVLARQPLAGGALAGSLGPGVKLALGDDRRTLDDARLTAIAETIGSLAGLVSHVPPAARSCATARGRFERASTRRPNEIECATVAELALRFAIDQPGVTAVLPRLHRLVHVDEAISVAGAKPLSAALIARVIAELDELLATP